MRYPAIAAPGADGAGGPAGYVLLCQARPASDLTVEARLIARVSEVGDQDAALPRRPAGRPCAGCHAGVFAAPAVEPLRFLPGQYLDVLVDGGHRRSFSIASPPHDSECSSCTCATCRAVASPARCSVKSAGGALLRIEGPLGQFVYRKGTPPVLMIAGGTGFAPIKSICGTSWKRGRSGDPPLLGCAPSQDLYEEARCSTWRGSYPNLRFTAVLSEASIPEPRIGVRAGCTKRCSPTTQPRRLRSLRGGAAGADRSDSRQVPAARADRGPAPLRLVRLRAASPSSHRPAPRAQILNRSRSSPAMRRLTCSGASQPRSRTKYCPSALRSIRSRSHAHQRVAMDAHEGRAELLLERPQRVLDEILALQVPHGRVLLVGEEELHLLDRNQAQTLAVACGDVGAPLARLAAASRCSCGRVRRPACARAAASFSLRIGLSR